MASRSKPLPKAAEKARKPPGEAAPLSPATPAPSDIFMAEGQRLLRRWNGRRTQEGAMVCGSCTEPMVVLVLDQDGTWLNTRKPRLVCRFQCLLCNWYVDIAER